MRKKLQVGIVLGILFIGLLMIFQKNETNKLESFLIDVSLEGGSGKASVTSPAVCQKIGDFYRVQIQWSSSNYDYMIVDGKKYLPVNTTGNSLFEIPVSNLEKPLTVIADTTAMSVPHEVTYTLYFDRSSMTETEQEKKESTPKEQRVPKTLGKKLHWKEKQQNKYATEFSIDIYTDDFNDQYYLISIVGEGQYLVVPEKMDQDVSMEEWDIPEEIVVLKRPKQIYLAASQIMDIMDAVGAMDMVRFSALREQDWYVKAAKEKMEKGEIVYAGKYSAPDYEMILEKGCDLAIENTMIYHNPEVKEKIESLGIPVLVDRSSYEKEPFGRMEWVKLYGVLTGRERQAEEAFEQQIKACSEIAPRQGKKPTIAYFYISANGEVKVRKKEDYFSKMIELAQGEGVFAEGITSEGDASSTVTLQIEEFYVIAKESDYLLYNSTVDGEIKSIRDLLDKSELFSNFKAVKEGKVFCTKKNLYQSTMELGSIIAELYQMTNEKTDMEYLFPIQ